MKTKKNSQGSVSQPKQSWHVILLTAVITMLFGVVSSNAQTSPNGDFTDGFDNNTSGAQDSTASWIYWYNQPNNGQGSASVALDTTVSNGGAGSLKISIPFGLPFRNVDQGVWFGNFDNTSPYDTTIKYDGTQFTNISFDIMMDPSDPLSPTGDYGIIGVGLLDAGTPAGGREDGTVLIPGAASNTWVHLTVPVNKSETYLSSPGVIGVDFVYSTYDNNSENSFLTNPVVMHIDNLRVKLGVVSNPPPVMSIRPITPGLNFVQGSISSQFDRQNLRTLNSPSSSYSWVGRATPSNPVTYSFTVNKWNAPDLTFHIFVTPNGTGGESASDYNETNVLMFNIGANTNGTVANILWKTNFPSSNPTNVAVAITNSVSLVGTWQLQFTGNTSGSIIEPDSTSYPFTLDPGLAAGLANPGPYITFGILPNINTNTILDESVVISQISIIGADPLSVNYAATDNFLTDSTLDTTNTWAVNALFPASILFVPTNDVYSVRWTLPAVGFTLEVNTNLAGTNSWVVPSSLTTVTLFPGANTLVPNGSLPAGKNAFFRLAKLIPTQLQVLWPGETNAPNTVTGKIGTPTPASLSGGGIVNVTINEVDANFNIVNVSGDNIHLTTSADAIMPNDASIANGTLQQTVVFQSTGAQTVTASDTSNPGTIAPNTSSSITVGP